LNKITEKNQKMYNIYKSWNEYLIQTDQKIQEEQIKSNNLAKQLTTLQGLFDKCKDMSNKFNDRILEATNQINKLTTPGK
jgi:hypothetical protein